MKHLLQKIVTTALAGTLIFGASTNLVTSKTFGECLSRVQAQTAVQDGRFLPFNTVKQRNNIAPNATVLNQKVCRIDGQPYYMFDVLSSYGPTTHFELRATDGTPYIAS